MADRVPSGGEATVEIVLTDHDGRPIGGRGDGDPGETIPPNWRRTVGLASLAGAVLGLVVAALLLNRSDDDTPDDEPPSSEPGDGPISDRTPPPTLTPLADLPLPDLVPRGTISTAHEGTTSQTRDLFQPTPSTLYPRATEVPADGRFELEPAVAALGDDLPRRAHTELGENGDVLRATIIRDPANDRFGITLTVANERQRIVVDVAGGVTYLGVGDSWFVLPNDDLLANTDTTDAREYFGRMLLGPLRPDTLDAAVIDPGALVSLPETGARAAAVAREYTVVLPGATIPEWRRYVFGSATESPAVDPPRELTYAVYVTELGELDSAVGVSLVGDEAQRLTHSIELLDTPITVELPDPDEVVERPGSSD